MKTSASLASVGLLLLVSACSEPPPAPSASHVAATTTSAATTATATAQRSGTPFLPGPNRKVPRHPRRLAHELERVTNALHRSITTWTTEGHPSKGGPPRAVVLQGLYQQRIYRKLGRNAHLARRTIPRLGTKLRRIARAHRRASVRLRTLVTPIDDPDAVRTGKSAPAERLKRFDKAGERRFGVAWEVLAAVNFIETKFNKIRSASSAGAQGPMQFLRSTWRQYGLGGNINGPHDAILGAANYLHASGAPGSYRQALYSYNHADAYVDAVLIYAHRMMKDPRRFFEYYSWQLFVITTHGDVQLTGPGHS